MDDPKSVVLFVNNNSSDPDLEALFDKIGCATLRCAYPEKLLDVLLEKKVELVLLDVDSIGGKTVDLVRMIRHSDRPIPIVTLATSYSSDGYDIEIDLRLAGVSVCRGKPLSEEEAGWLVDSARQYSRNNSSQPFRK